MSNEVHDVLESDAKALIWSKDREFHAEELGTDLDRRPLITEGETPTPGAQALEDKCVKPFRLETLLAYKDALEGDQKILLDCWLGRTKEGRVAVFTNYRIKDVVQSSTRRSSKLP